MSTETADAEAGAAAIEKPPELKKHPLQRLNLRWIQSWSEWMKLHLTFPGAEFQDALIRCGFKVKAETSEDRIGRIVYYLKLAEGHSDPRYFGEQEPLGRAFQLPCASEKKEFRTWGEVRSHLAGQAFKELAYHFFRTDHKASYFSSRYAWADRIFNEEVLDALFHFFRRDGSRLINLSNNADDPSSAMARQFLLAWCSIRWRSGNWHHQSEKRGWDAWNDDREVSDRMIQILYALGELGVFTGQDGYAFAREDYPALEKIVSEETFYSSSGEFDTTRKKASCVEEAASLGSPAGTLCLILKNRWRFQDRSEQLKREKKRLEKVHQTGAKIEKRIENLAGKPAS